MSHNQGRRVEAFQLAQQGQQTSFLRQRAGVLGMSVGIQPAFIADADAVSVVVPAVRSHLLQRPSAVNLTVAGDVEVVADVLEPAVADVVRAALLKAKALPLAGGRAMENNQAHRSHHWMHEVKPNTPAKAVATATMALSTKPQTEDFLELDMIINLSFASAQLIS